MKVEVIKQFSVFMPNKPGSLSRLAKLFADKKINILGIASEVRDDSGLVRIAVAPDAEVSPVLSQAGFSSVETRLLSVDIDDRPGELLRVADALSAAKLNITTVYGTGFEGQRSRVLIAAEHTDKAMKVLDRLQQAPVQA